MSEPTLQAQIDAARAYEALFVPALFKVWSSRVADLARIQPGDRALEVACGTGILARELATRTADGAVAALDANPGMIAVARELAPSVDWRVGAAESLPFADGSFDAVVCQFGLMFFADRQQALGEMMRVLAPEGRLVVAVWDAIEHVPAYATLVTILEEEAGRAAADALRAPFALGRRDALATLVAAAALPSVQIATERGTARFPDVRTMVGAELRGWLPVMGVTLAEDQIERILRSAETALKGYITADGRVTFPVSAHLVTATTRDARLTGR